MSNTVSGLLSVIFCLIVWACLGLYLQNYSWKQQAIERGFAQYCEKTGEFSWINECEK